MLSRSDLLRLIEVREGPCASMYMPTHRTGRERQQDELRHKNIVREAGRRLAEQGVSEEKTSKILEPVEELPKKTDIWNHRLDGLAIFAAPSFFRSFNLPIGFAELAIVDDHFHISPLISHLRQDRRFYILALAKDSADLYEATRHSMVERSLPELAPIVVDGVEKAHQFHSQRAPTQGKGGVDEAVFHGQGAPDDREKVDLANFYKRQVAPAVSNALRGEEVPLVLACVDYLAPIYRQANTCSNLVAGHVSGSPGDYSEQELQESAWNLAHQALADAEQAARRKYADLSASERTQNEPKPLLDAARRGRIETLFVANGVAGRTVSPGLVGNPVAASFDIVEQAVELTLQNSGQVLAVDEVPGAATLAAVLRY